MRRRVVRTLVGLVVVAAVVTVSWIGLMWWESRLPGTYNVMDHGSVDFGGGTESGHVHGAGSDAGVSVVDLRGPRGGAPVARFELTAERAIIELASGREVRALTFDGRSPGPELRVRQGELVEVTLLNEDVQQGVTIHWHGVDVPNAEDGVAGVTQDAVLPGERYVYRFRAEQIGTFWYHTHQVSSTEVRRGLFGTLVIERPQKESTIGLDRTVVAHTYDGIPTLNADEGTQRLDAESGTQVRLRLVNTDNSPHRFVLLGTPFRVLALDGTELNGPGDLQDVAVMVPGGGRADLGFAMPTSAVWLSLAETSAALAFNTDETAVPVTPELPDFDPLDYGRPAATPFDATSAFDRRFELTISRKPGFFDGRPGLQWAINGHIFPDVPTFHVEHGELVEVTIVNETDSDHPMHLHGHHVLVLGRDREPASRSPWWPDTLSVEPGEEYRVAFRADNPGIWMDHCHNLLHAAEGLTMHVAYAGVTTPFVVGGARHNEPE